MSNTRLVTIETESVDKMCLKLYYGNKLADKASFTVSEGMTYQEKLDVIEDFRMHGMSE